MINHTFKDETVHQRIKETYSQYNKEREREITTREDQVLLARIRSGKHLAFQSYQHSLDENVSSKCPRCGEGEHNVEHWLCKCSATLDARRKLFGEEMEGGLALLTKYPSKSVALTAVKMPILTTVISLDLANVNHGPTFEVEAVVRPNLNIDATNIALKLDLEKWPHLCDLDIPEFSSGQVELLIGQDSSELLTPESIRKGKRGDPFAIQTPLGWAINGPIDPYSQSQCSSHFVQIGKKALLNKNLNELWEIEDANKEDVGWSKNDEVVVNAWNESVKVLEDHYVLNIPFKEAAPKLLNNRALAEKRLSSLDKRPAKDEVMKTRYTEENLKLLEKGYAEEVPIEEIKRNDGKVHYLPHNPVHNPKKPEKYRPVFDCAAQERMIRTIHCVLLGATKLQILDDEALMTLCTIVESNVSNRPYKPAHYSEEAVASWADYRGSREHRWTCANSSSANIIWSLRASSSQILCLLEGAN